MAGAAITGGTVTIEGCGTASLQGDVRFANVLEDMGASVVWNEHSITVSGPSDGRLRGMDKDCNDIPDAAMTLAVVALFAEGPTAIRNVYNWRLKETERMKAIVAELGKLGARVEEGRDYCIITPPDQVPWCFALMIFQSICVSTPVTISGYVPKIVYIAGGLSSKTSL